MRFVMLIIQILIVSPIVYMWQFIKRGKIFRAIYVFFMSPYAVIPFVYLGYKTTWWIGFSSLVAFMLIGALLNYRLGMYRLSKMTPEQWDESSEAGMKIAEGMPSFDEDVSVIKSLNRIASTVADVI